jgi:predicted PurR-regulated permease PerM
MMELSISNRTIVRIVVIVLGSVVAVRLITALHTQLIWILTALFLALALEPAVDRISRFMPRRSRSLSVLLVLGAVFSILVFISIVLVPPFASQLYHLVISLPSAYGNYIDANPAAAHFVNSYLNSASVSNALQQFSKQLLSFGGSAVLIARGVFGGIVAGVTVLLLTFFMVLEGPRWTSLFWEYLPPARRARYQGILKQMHGTVTGYVGGNLFTSLIAAVATAAMLIILRAPYAFALGLLVGVMDLIPLIGASLAAVLVCLLVLVFKGLTSAFIVAIFFGIYQQVENNALQPIVFSKAVEVSPLVTTIALILGASLAGFIGALVAIPVAASLQILLRYYLISRRPKSQAAEA